MDEAEGTYRGEVMVIMAALADVRSDVRQILAHIEGDDDEEEAQDTEDA